VIGTGLAAALFALVVALAACFRVAFGQRDGRLFLIAVAFLAPLAIALWLPVAEGRLAFAAATVVSLPALLVAERRRGTRLRPPLELFTRNPFAPFAALYVLAALFGLWWAIARGNDLLLAFAQTWTAALFAIGFVWLGPRLRALATPRFWLLFSIATAVLTLPALIDLVASLAADPGTFDRVIAKTDFYAFVCLLLALGLVAPIKPLAGTALAGFFGLVTLATFTRSYWLAATVGVTLLIGLVLRARPRLPSARTATVTAAVTAVFAGIVLASPLGGFAQDRLANTQRGSVDLAVDVRSLELSAAIDQIERSPLTGIGSGGKFAAVYQTSADTIAYGGTNFVHNAYVYFPLKFGVLGFAALVALAFGLAQVVAGLLRSALNRPADRTWVAVAFALLAASVTAPNLVDPLYSMFCGAALALAGMASESALARAPVRTPADKERPRSEAVPIWG
jgi:FtsH-binding integral membrane protein